MASIFSKIIAREIPAQFLYEDDHCVVILDKFPAVTGQTLVIPKQEISYIVDLNEDVYTHLWLVAKKIASALDAEFTTERTCFVVEGFEVPHVHIKLYPMQHGEMSLGSILPLGKEAGDKDLENIAVALRRQIEKS